MVWRMPVWETFMASYRNDWPVRKSIANIILARRYRVTYSENAKSLRSSETRLSSLIDLWKDYKGFTSNHTPKPEARPCYDLDEPILSGFTDEDEMKGRSSTCGKMKHTKCFKREYLAPKVRIWIDLQRHRTLNFRVYILRSHRILGPQIAKK